MWDRVKCLQMRYRNCQGTDLERLTRAALCQIYDSIYRMLNPNHHSCHWHLIANGQLKRIFP